MLDHKMRKKVDPKEFELPETVYVRSIEDRVFQSLVLECLSKIDGIGLIGGSLISSILNREGPEHVKGIGIEQDNKSHSVAIKIEINVSYGVSIPQKAEEIQSKVSELITHATGLHVSSVHVAFKNLIPPTSSKKGMSLPRQFPYSPVLNTEEIQERYVDRF